MRTGSITESRLSFKTRAPELGRVGVMHGGDHTAQPGAVETWPTCACLNVTVTVALSEENGECAMPRSGRVRGPLTRASRSRERGPVGAEERNDRAAPALTHAGVRCVVFAADPETQTLCQRFFLSAAVPVGRHVRHEAVSDVPVGPLRRPLCRDSEAPPNPSFPLLSVSLV